MNNENRIGWECPICGYGVSPEKDVCPHNHFSSPYDISTSQPLRRPSRTDDNISSPGRTSANYWSRPTDADEIYLTKEALNTYLSREGIIK